MSEEDKKNGKDEEENLPEKEESFDDGGWISLSGEEEEHPDTPHEKPVEPPPESPPPAQPDYMTRGSGYSVNDILESKRRLEFESTRETPEGQSDETQGESAPQKMNRPLEIHVHADPEGTWKITPPDAEALDSKVREKASVHLEITSEKVRVDHEHLSKLDETLKNELHSIRKRAERGMIPGEFLEARRRLAEEGVLECPKCKVKVIDTPGKIDFCPQCGLPLDDYLHQYKEEWERKHKNTTSLGVIDFGEKKKKKGKSAWELWKDEQGIDPDAELLRCPKCGYEEYDDPFVANKCPKCRIPLDLHLDFPRPYVRKREAARKMRRAGVDMDEFNNKKKKGR